MSKTKPRVIETARRLFAIYGYEGVSTRMLAAEVGISVSTLNYHIGSKADIYVLIFEETFHAENRLVTNYFESIDPATFDAPELFRDLLLRFVYDHVELMARYPEGARLWLQRWLAGPNSQAAQMNVEFGGHLYKMVRNVLRKGQAAGLLSRPFNMRYFLLGFTWMQYGFFSEGTHISAEQAGTLIMPDAEEIGQFKQHMGLYVCNMLGLPVPETLLLIEDVVPPRQHTSIDHGLLD